MIIYFELHNVSHLIRFKEIQFSISRFLNVLATDFLVFRENLSHHSYLVGATDSKQSVPPI